MQWFSIDHKSSHYCICAQFVCRPLNFVFSVLFSMVSDRVMQSEAKLGRLLLSRNWRLTSNNYLLPSNNHLLRNSSKTNIKQTFSSLRILISLLDTPFPFSPLDRQKPCRPSDRAVPHGWLPKDRTCLDRRLSILLTTSTSTIGRLATPDFRSSVVPPHPTWSRSRNVVNPSHLPPLLLPFPFRRRVRRGSPIAVHVPESFWTRTSSSVTWPFVPL
jgi:hypothetical protein